MCPIHIFGKRNQESADEHSNERAVAVGRKRSMQSESSASLVEPLSLLKFSRLYVWNLTGVAM